MVRARVRILYLVGTNISLDIQDLVLSFGNPLQTDASTGVLSSNSPNLSSRDDVSTSCPSHISLGTTSGSSTQPSVKSRRWQPD